MRAACACADVAIFPPFSLLQYCFASLKFKPPAGAKIQTSLNEVGHGSTIEYTNVPKGSLETSGSVEGIISPTLVVGAWFSLTERVANIIVGASLTSVTSTETCVDMDKGGDPLSTALTSKLYAPNVTVSSWLTALLLASVICPLLLSMANVVPVLPPIILYCNT